MGLAVKGQLEFPNWINRNSNRREVTTLLHQLLNLHLVFKLCVVFQVLHIRYYPLTRYSVMKFPSSAQGNQRIKSWLERKVPPLKNQGSKAYSSWPVHPWFFWGGHEILPSWPVGYFFFHKRWNKDHFINQSGFHGMSFFVRCSFDSRFTPIIRPLRWRV